MNIEEVGQKLRIIAEKENGRMFLGWPDRWYDFYTVRCINDHVSTRTLKTEKGDRCLACYQEVHLTFPEDKDGKLE